MRIKRKEYDTFGTEGFGQKYAQEDIFNNVDLDSILRSFGFGRWRRIVFVQKRRHARPNTQGSPFGGAYSTGGNDFFWIWRRTARFWGRSANTERARPFI